MDYIYIPFNFILFYSDSQVYSLYFHTYSLTYATFFLFSQLYFPTFTTSFSYFNINIFLLSQLPFLPVTTISVLSKVSFYPVSTREERDRGVRQLHVFWFGDENKILYFYPIFVCLLLTFYIYFIYFFRRSISSLLPFFFVFLHIGYVDFCCFSLAFSLPVLFFVFFSRFSLTNEIFSYIDYTVLVHVQ